MNGGDVMRRGQFIAMLVVCMWYVSTARTPDPYTPSPVVITAPVCQECVNKEGLLRHYRDEIAKWMKMYENLLHEGLHETMAWVKVGVDNATKIIHLSKSR